MTARRRHEPPAWLTAASVLFAPVLAVRGLTFPLHSSQLRTLLYLTLPLLAWVAALTAVTARRRPDRAERGAATG